MRTRKQIGLGILLAAAGAAVLWAQAGPEEVRLTVGKSIVIDYPADIARISTSNPDVVDASPVTAREVLLHGKSLGTVTLVVWSKTGQRNFYNIDVEQNLEPLRQILKGTFPNEPIQVQSSRDSVSLTGRASSKDVSDRAAALAGSYGKTIVNNLQLPIAPVEKQILLRVKFAELDRSTASQFAINFVNTGAGNTVGRITTGGFPAPAVSTINGTGGTAANSTFSISDALNIFAFNPNLNLGVLIKALQQQNLLQILTEPNLVTTNGKEASFLEGGEFPVPILQGGANSGAVTIQFREFGIRLTFTPFITDNKTIKMHLRQEVPTLDKVNGVTLNGFFIPALATRRAETDVELAEGQSFVVAGLVDNRETDSFSKIPVLGSLPIFGALFKTKDETKSRQELVLLVTPEVTEPLGVTDTKPSIYMPKDFLVKLDPNDIPQ